MEDPTVVDPATRAAIVNYIGTDIREADPGLLQFVVDSSRKAGNKAFKARNYKGAPNAKAKTLQDWAAREN
jgi:hypothetical protein